MNDGVVDGKTVRLCNNINEYAQPELPQKYIYQDMLRIGEKFEEFREDSLIEYLTMEKVIIKKEHCPHSRFYSKKLEYDPLLYVKNMKKIVKITIETFSKIFIDYFTDAKIIEGKKPNNYYYYLASNNVNDQYVTEYMNVGVVDGKTVNNTNEYLRPQLPERLRAPLPPNYEYKEFKEYDDDDEDNEGIVYV
ncbi:hypothetical protein ACTFIY_001469 [Dictyostelium cf. discoideum]